MVITVAGLFSPQTNDSSLPICRAPRCRFLALEPVPLLTLHVRCVSPEDCVSDDRAPATVSPPLTAPSSVVVVVG